MTRQSLLKLSAIVLILIALAMVVIAFQLKALPPGLTAVGFLFIALVFLKE